MVKTYVKPSAFSAATVTALKTKLAIENITNDSIAVGMTSPFGKIQIGDTDSYASGKTGLRLTRNFTGNAINIDNVSDVSELNPTGGTAAFCSFNTSLEAKGALNYDHLAGFQDRLIHSGTGTITNIFGFLSVPTLNGAVETRYGMWIFNPAGTGVIQNNYGLYINELTRGAALNYAIYTAGVSPSYFGGNVTLNAKVGIGTAATDLPLQINRADFGAPVTSGTTQTYGINRLSYKLGGVVLDMGLDTFKGAWLQATNKTNLSLTYPILLNQNGGLVGIGVATPTARLHLPASSAAADLASLKITPGVVATTPVSGNIESDGTHLYWTNSAGTRLQLDNA